MGAGARWLKAFEHWHVAARPDRDEPEWWAGAPSVVRDDAGVFWLAARMRTAEAPLGFRGYEIRIYRSEDGLSFQPVHGLRREDVGVPGFERPALVRDPATGVFRLYGCSPLADGWSILRFDDSDRPDRFRPERVRTVIAPTRDEPQGVVTPRGYKDPVILHAAGAWHCFVIGILGMERMFHFVSEDGELWTPVPDRSTPSMDLSGWHNYAVRPASVLPMGAGYLFVYEGSHTTWPDPAYNISTGLAYTMDFDHFTDLTPEEPLLRSPTPGRLPVWRYSHWLRMEDHLRVYAEVECSNGSHEIRVFRLPFDI